MTNFFNYSTLSVTLTRETRNCNVVILNDNKFFNTASFLNELERFFDWLTNKVEINSVTLSFEANESELFTREDLAMLDEQALSKQLQLLTRLSWAQVLLPQTIIWNFTKQACSFCIELSMGADLRYASPSFNAVFNSLDKGITPMAGMNTLANHKANSSMLMQYNLASQTVPATDLISAGVIGKVIFSDNDLSETTKKISKQSPTSRIQFKRSFNNQLIKEMEELMLEEISFSNSSLAIGDFKRYANEQKFISPREVSKVLKNTPTVNEKKEEVLSA